MLKRRDFHVSIAEMQGVLAARLDRVGQLKHVDAAQDAVNARPRPACVAGHKVASGLAGSQIVEKNPMSSIDLTVLSVRDLLQLDAAVIAELRRRKLVRTNNKPLGDIAEAIVCAARGGVLEPNSTRSHDITTSHGDRVQVKAMGVRSAGLAGKFGAFRSSGFTTAVFLAFGPDFGLIEAWEIPSAAIEEARFSAHINGRQPTLRWVRSAGTDVRAEMQAAWAAITAANTHASPAAMTSGVIGPATQLN